MNTEHASSPRPATVPITVYFGIFTVSGFSGLIYESIWSHYLKLLLGHAAYAQTLVLAIFMGGMALGAWFASRRCAHWRTPLLVYAMVEALVGVCAIGFHRYFVALGETLHESIIPMLGSPAAIDAAKWSLAALSILPQSCLLGMTFPLMTAGLLRRYPGAPGHALASLYFCNSLGAALGVIASGFWLIAAIGLPGTIATAGTINVLLAGTVGWLERSTIAQTGAVAAGAVGHGPDRIYRGMLVVALGTGFASFIYEIGWIRMLSMVLGAATHSFELMLSAFILGLALGGGWIRGRIDTLADTPGFLAAVQIVMGGCALLSLALYDHAFTVMRWLLGALARSADGYVLFNIGSHALALFIMLPATFCAGMTLPLITHVLLRRGCGERSIGAVYAANTIGAILGVMFMVHVGMPLLGLRDAITVGAAVDLGLGVALLGLARGALANRRRLALGTGVSVAAVLATLGLVELDPYRMASGVYRYGRSSLPANDRILYHGDGKTATVNLIGTPDGRRSIMTNGKPDAAIAMAPDSDPARDEVTMVLAAAIPLALRPQAGSAANIGLGSGLTTSTLLGSSRLKVVDTIEIEAAMVEAARGFRPRVDRAYEDPRSRIHIDDAKTFFSAHGRRYDIIVSEPSNPWVSGVANLFTSEFYRLIKRHLTADGVLVQWLQTYEVDMPLIASVVNALGQEFAHYVVYHTDDTNLVIVASQSGDLTTLDPYVFGEPALAGELARVGLRTLGDFRMHHIGDRATLEPLFASYRVPANSDYYPYLDQHAAKARFMDRHELTIVAMTDAPLPLLEMLDADRGEPPAAVTRGPYNTQLGARLRGRAAYDIVLGRPAGDVGLPEWLEAHAALLASDTDSCDGDGAAASWFKSVYRLGNSVMPHLTGGEGARLWARLRRSPCVTQIAGTDAAWLDLLEASSRRDATAMLQIATALLTDEDAEMPEEKYGYLVASAMLASLHLGDDAGALAVWSRFGADRWNPDEANIVLRTLLSNAVYRDAAGTARGGARPPASPAP